MMMVIAQQLDSELERRSWHRQLPVAAPARLLTRRTVDAEAVARRRRRGTRSAPPTARGDHHFDHANDVLLVVVRETQLLRLHLVRVATRTNFTTNIQAHCTWYTSPPVALVELVRTVTPSRSYLINKLAVCPFM
jgi:hypothetical protein